MAFETVPGVKVRTGDLTFIIGDYIAVYERGFDFPRIFNWVDIASVTETTDRYIIVSRLKDKNKTRSFETFEIMKSDFKNLQDFFSARAIIEGAIGENPAIAFKHRQRILPTKDRYKIRDVPSDAYVAHGVYNDREINYSNVILVNTLLGKMFVIIGAVFGALVAVALLFFFKPQTLVRFPLYYFAIAAFSGIAGAVSVFLSVSAVAQNKYNQLYKSDPALGEDITHVVCNDGFASVETCIYTGNHLLPWDGVERFIETSYVYIITKNNKAIFWLPKRLFDKAKQAEISQFIAKRITEGKVDKQTLLKKKK